MAALRSRIGAITSEAELRGLLASANLGPLPLLRAGSLPDQQQQRSDAFAIQASQLTAGRWPPPSGAPRHLLKVSAPAELGWSC